MKADRRALRLLIRAIAPDRASFGWTLTFLLGAGLLEALGPLLGKTLIDDHLMTGDVDTRVAAMLLAGLVLAGWSAAILRYFTLIRMSRIAMHAVLRLRQWVHAHVLNLPMAYFDQHNSGQLVSRITNDTEQIRRLYVQVLFEVMQGLAVLIGAVVAMAWLDWRLMLIVLALLPIMVGIIWLYRRLSSAAVARTRQLRSEINAQMAESIAGMAVLQASRASARATGRFTDTNSAYYNSRVREVRANAWMLRPALDLVSLLLIVAAVGAFGTLPFDGIQIGLLYAFISYIERVVEPLIQITQQFSMLQQSLASATRLDQLLEQPQQEAPDGQARPAGGDVRIEALNFGYQPDAPVLRDLNLHVEAGSFVGIVGHTGAGKSSLLSLLLRFYRADSGRIAIGGAPLESIDDDGFHENIGLVPQEPFLLAASARDNIDMGRGLSRQSIEEAARQAGLDAYLRSLPDGYDTTLGEGGARLSAGQKQLLAVARALAGQPQILLLDEATSRVDSATEQTIARAIAALHGQVTVMAIAHRLSTIRHADNIVVLNHGQIAERGTHQQLMRLDAGIYRRLYELQRIERPGGPA